MNGGWCQQAEKASVRAFANSYFREIEGGVWHRREDWLFQGGHDFAAEDCWVLELRLPQQQQTLAFNVSFRSRVGPHRFGQVFSRPDGRLSWQRLSGVCTLLQLIAEIYALTPDVLVAKRVELSSRVFASIENLSEFLRQRHSAPQLLCESFIESEQSLLFGHWLHPTPKSRQGMQDWHHSHYSPEMAGQFQLHYFIATRNLVCERSLLAIPTSEKLHQSLVPELVLSPDQVVLPVHPLQADWLMHQAQVRQWLAEGKLQNLGSLGPYFQATSSVRTVYSPALDYMLKLSLPVKITNSRRINKRHELDAGLYIGQLLTDLEGQGADFGFEIIRDPAYITLQSDDTAETGFEIILRDNPFRHRPGQRRRQMSLVALLQEPLLVDGQSRLRELIEALSLQEGRSLEQVGRDWFDAYWQCAFEPLLRLYDRYGLALEAHQQNSLLDVTEGYPSRYYYRDNQGFYLAESLRSQLVARVPALQSLQAVFYDEKIIQQRFTYYLVVNQLFAIVHRLAADGVLAEDELLAIVRAKLRDLFSSLTGLAIPIVESLLCRSQLPTKANLRTRIEDVDELAADMEAAVYGEFPNPLVSLSERVTRAKEYPLTALHRSERQQRVTA